MSRPRALGGAVAGASKKTTFFVRATPPKGSEGDDARLDQPIHDDQQHHGDRARNRMHGPRVGCLIHVCMKISRP